MSDSAVVVNDQQKFFVIFVARLTIDRVLATVLVSVWTLVSVLVRRGLWSHPWIGDGVYTTLLCGPCRIIRWDPHSTPVDSYQEFLGILGLDHKAAPLAVGGPSDWYNAAKRTGWECVATRCLKFPVGLTTEAAFERDWASPASAKPTDEFEQPVFHGFFFLDQVETTLLTRETV